MNKYRLNIDGIEVFGLPGQTILDVARENDIFIPTLCYDERTTIYGACGLCVCEVEGNPKLVKACATEISPNMIVMTDTDRVTESRKTNLELLLSNHVGDCRPPCVLACPAQTDCQGYVGLIANGEHEEALKLIKTKIPMPGSLGRVCPHPCETDCRRGLIDEPVSIMQLKRFAGDLDLLYGDSIIPDCEESTGKSVGIVGGGPLGLSAAYFLRLMGHDVTVYEAMAKAGGMLRYGIPEYRLPKNVVDAEINVMEEMGVNVITNTMVGVDIPFKTVKEDHDAILLGIGAWVSTGVGCPGEDAEGVIGGIDMLRKVVRNESLNLGKNVAIVGGGNTAMDACRTAVRLGAEKVYNIYRRTKDEMPADMIEIVEAEEEGVIFKNLTNPLEIRTGADGRVSEMELQIMELGEPDESGRRRPLPVEGKTEIIPVDTVILAIGQAVDASLFGDVDKTKRGAIAYDKDTFMTSVPGIFAGGDCGNDKISIAVEAIADAKKAAEIIDHYLMGEEVAYREEYVVTRDDITEEDFADRERHNRPEIGELSPENRRNNFLEVIPNAYDEDSAVEEANRCLECGCHDYFECKLVDYANLYDVKPERLSGDVNKIEFEDDHPFIARDPNKCILCGLCVRVCDEVMGIGALGLVDRGFDTVVKPNLEKPLAESGCVSCGQCVSVCPVGALQERQTVSKEIPVDSYVTDTTCAYCSVGCSFELESIGDMLIKANPTKDGFVNKGLACGKGRWGFDCSVLEGKLEDPLMKVGLEFEAIDYNEAFVLAAKQAESVAMRYGKESVAVAISDRFTNEEAYVMKKMADLMGARTLCFNNRKSGVEKVLGLNASPNTIDELLSTEVIVAVGFNMVDNPVIGLKIKEAAENGARVVLINPEDAPQHFGFAEKTIYTDNDMAVLKEFAKGVLTECETRVAGMEGLKEFEKSLESVVTGEEMSEVAGMYCKAKKAMLVFQQNNLTEEASALIADIALASGHIGSPRDGILQIKPKNNSQGIADIGIIHGAEAMEGVKALLIFGENPPAKYLEGLEFLMVSDTHMTKAGERADLIIPGTGFASTDGTYTNTERRLLPVEAAIDEGIEISNWEIASNIAYIYEEDFGFEDTEDIAMELADNVIPYRYNDIGKIYGGVLTPSEPKLVAVGDGAYMDVQVTTDALMMAIKERLPKPVEMTK